LVAEIALSSLSKARPDFDPSQHHACERDNDRLKPVVI